MTTTKKFSALRSRAEEIAAQKKALEDAEKEYRKTIDDAVKHAGRTRAEFVEKLYDYFGIEQETTERRDKNGKVVLDKDGRPIEVKTDKNESVRIQKLGAAFASLVDGEPHDGDADEDDGSVDDIDVPVPSASTSGASFGHSFAEDEVA